MSDRITVIPDRLYLTSDGITFVWIGDDGNEYIKKYPGVEGYILESLAQKTLFGGHVITWTHEVFPTLKHFVDVPKMGSWWQIDDRKD